MNKRADILNELKALNSHLDPSLPAQVYTVPQGYFEGFAHSVLARIRTQSSDSTSELESLSPLLASISRKMPYQVPGGYFESAGEALPQLVKEDALPALLEFIEKDGPYRVPAGYFEALPSVILSKVERPKARVVAMPRRWMKSAVAAAITGIIAISGYFYFNQPEKISVDDPRWVSQKIKTVDTKTLENFVKTTDVDPLSPETAKAKPSGSDVDALLEDVSTSQLAYFLEQVPTDDEDLMIN